MSDDPNAQPSPEQLARAAARHASSAYALHAARGAQAPRGTRVDAVVDASRTPPPFGHVSSVSAAAKRARGANFAEKLAGDHRLHLSGFTDAAKIAGMPR
jgi:hypothetical protein